jgi:hypothetical protein
MKFRQAQEGTCVRAIQFLAEILLFRKIKEILKFSHKTTLGKRVNQIQKKISLPQCYI